MLSKIKYIFAYIFAVPVTAAPVKAVNCSAHGCQQGCVKGDDGKVNCQCKNGYKLKEDQKSCEGTFVMISQG